jgi:hypothetical protein
MPDIYNKTSSLTGELNTQKDILYKARLQLTASGSGPGGIFSPYYWAGDSVQLDFLRLGDIIPRVEVVQLTGDPADTVTYCPYTVVEPGTKNVQKTVEVFYGRGDPQAEGNALFVFISVFSINQESDPTDFLVTVYNQEVGRFSKEQYPLVN